MCNPLGWEEGREQALTTSARAAILRGVPAALLACPRCHRQYDVGAHAPGARIRCLCGNLCTVERPRARQVEMLHCSNCGGKLAAGRPTCEYCSSAVKLAERGLGPTCPECFATTVAGAKHCGGCGVRLAPEGVLRALSERACPRCKQALSECESALARYVECTACAGLWLDEELFLRVAERREAGLAALLVKGAPPATTASLEREVRYLPCPVCGQLMNRRNFAEASGVILDWCRGHGWWFDAFELERVLAFLEQGGLEHARTAQHERRLQELRREQERLERARDLQPPAPFPLPRRAPRNVLESLVELVLTLW